jgi:chromosome segregation ATPase
MPKHPTRPGISVAGTSEDAESSGKHRTCGVGRAALARTQQLTQRLDEHAEEDGERLGELTRDVEQANKKIDTINERVGDLRVDVAKMSSVVHNISMTLAEQNEIKHVRVIAEVETGAAEKIAAIDLETDMKKTRRAFWLKIAIVIVGLAGTAVGVIIEHYR